MKIQSKFTLIIILICVSFYTSRAQNVVHRQLSLSVERTAENKAQELYFAPNKKLKVRTTTGEVLVMTDYSFLDDAIVLKRKKVRDVEKNDRYLKVEKKAVHDTISLTEIDWIKGRVLEDGGRKDLGFIVMAVGVVLFSFPILGVVVTNGAAVALLAIPFVPVIIEGFKMTKGIRKFKTSKGWQVKLE